MTDQQIIIIVLCNILIAGIIIFIVFKYIYKNAKPTVNNIAYGSATVGNLSSAIKISSRPFLFGLEKKFINSEELYFDDQNLYAANKEGQIATFSLLTIKELSCTSVQINKRPVWQIILLQDNADDINFKFTHNYSLWNKSFYHFYLKVQEINPDAVKSKWSLWRM